jgi:hypothetical protein
VTHDSGPGAPPPGYGPGPAYGSPSPSGQQPRKRRTGLWLGLTGGIVAVVVIVAVVLVAAKPGSSGNGGGSNAELGASACVPSGKLTSGAGPWKLITPQTLCGMAKETSAQAQQGNQALLNSTELVFSPVSGASIGSETSGFAASYETPNGQGVFRFVNYVGFDGTFNPQAAVTALASLDTNPDIPGNVFRSVAAGPHGGAMECAPNDTAEECVFATSTTFADIEISDTSRELTGAHTDTTAIDIRDALEAAG